MNSQIQAGVTGMISAVTHADSEIVNWSNIALGYLAQFASSNKGREYLAEEIAPWAEERGCPCPPDKRAWGAVISRAQKVFVIEKTGLAAKNKLSGNNSTWRPLWRTVETF